jgi:hypothetical protein
VEYLIVAFPVLSTGILVGVVIAARLQTRLEKYRR